MNELHNYICPKCGEPLHRESGSFKCVSNHVYDTARSGYVNLLLVQQMNTKLPGDNKLMVNARKSFLSKGYYDILIDAFSDCVKKYSKDGGTVLDAGCGEGIYTVSAAKKAPKMFFMGTDISKTAADAAAKRAKAEGVSNILFSVSSVFHLPVKSGSCDMLTTLFAPWCGEEFLRVLKPDGTLIMVIPGERHLWQLKAAIYDDPYLNEPKDTEPDGFSLLEKIPIKSKIMLDNNTDIQNLFSMTPYYYKTSEEGHRKVEALEKLETEIEFEILIYKKL
ncbi:MAG: methyltransferase domain-containing protein [Oscillospiraceae bacterium]